MKYKLHWVDEPICPHLFLACLFFVGFIELSRLETGTENEENKGTCNCTVFKRSQVSFYYRKQMKMFPFVSCKKTHSGAFKQHTGVSVFLLLSHKNRFFIIPETFSRVLFKMFSLRLPARLCFMDGVLLLVPGRPGFWPYNFLSWLQLDHNGYTGCYLAYTSPIMHINDLMEFRNKERYCIDRSVLYVLPYYWSDILGTSTPLTIPKGYLSFCICQNVCFLADIWQYVANLHWGAVCRCNAYISIWQLHVVIRF